jgi:hypothetical protein
MQEIYLNSSLFHKDRMVNASSSILLHKRQWFGGKCNIYNKIRRREELEQLRVNIYTALI